ncbi:hypothetical protein VOLCADRAFT_92308 [Volvox carteri f. nagariensis]|uniref:Uncharacterized protein n=1 Tax=Volvox carteri f. nagariensis TaxID=3068 RepID=D8TZB6_VOLCA|nr:uncharacterized protein VOLCADRAFT_92308 [Volvox carteri f. nagariensis]EFJ47245.1 hypothetical protein VOLCADRAFT_92308 [Volvox carteri f. nagariensis]|eukprot:XP_002951794.1 hypothetical protein VOLCADRAFT_92308 [Volvox carteri f. nagariensis]
MKGLRASSQRRRGTCTAPPTLPILLLALLALLAGDMRAAAAPAREDPLKTSADAADVDTTPETAPRPLLPKPAAAAMLPKAAPARVLLPTGNGPDSATASPIATTTAPRATPKVAAVAKRALLPKTVTADPGAATALGALRQTLLHSGRLLAVQDMPGGVQYRSMQARYGDDISCRGSETVRWGVWGSQEICCAAGAAFPDGCSVRPKECWVAESPSSRSCWKDNRRCLQGYGVFPSEEVCCSPGAAFPDGCLPPETTSASNSCWVVDTYFPARLCRNSTSLCAPRAGAQSWATKEACCAKGGAFPEGCSPAPPPTPCFMVGSYWPARTCVASDDIAVCNRGWGVYASEEVCCAPNVAFPEGCSAPPSGTEAGGSSSSGSSSSSSGSTPPAAGAGATARAPLPTKVVRLAPAPSVAAPQAAGLNDLK